MTRLLLYFSDTMNGIISDHKDWDIHGTAPLPIPRYTRDAAEETIRICMDRGILKEYLETCEKEVVNNMITLFKQEEAVRRYGNRKMAEGRAQGETEGQIKAYSDLVNDGTLTVEKAAKKMGMTVDQFKTAVERLMTAVEA